MRNLRKNKVVGPIDSGTNCYVDFHWVWCLWRILRELVKLRLLITTILSTNRPRWGWCWPEVITLNMLIQVTFFSRWIASTFYSCLAHRFLHSNVTTGCTRKANKICPNEDNPRLYILPQFSSEIHWPFNVTLSDWNTNFSWTLANWYWDQNVSVELTEFSLN